MVCCAASHNWLYEQQVLVGGWTCMGTTISYLVQLVLELLEPASPQEQARSTKSSLRCMLKILKIQREALATSPSLLKW